MAATKSSKDARQVGLSWHEKRGEVREKSTKGKQFRSSLQCLDNNEILLLLESILARRFGLVMNPPPPLGRNKRSGITHRFWEWSHLSTDAQK